MMGAKWYETMEWCNAVFTCVKICLWCCSMYEVIHSRTYTYTHTHTYIYVRACVYTILQDCQTQLGHMLPLGAYLIKPVQRVLKYSLLLEVRTCLHVLCVCTHILLLLFTCGGMYVCFGFIQIANKNSKNQLRTLTIILCDRVCENRSYLYKIHLFILSYLSLFLCGLHNICKFY